jgi:PBP1b-binding outer membrane lipoprotein LpoB
MTAGKLVGGLASLLAIVAVALSTSGCTTIAADTVLATKDSVKGLVSNSDLKAHAVRSIKTITINRVAVMPLIEAPGGEPLAPGAVDTVSAEVYSQCAVAGGWETIPQQDVDEALQKMPPVTLANLDETALKLAHEVSADGVLYGTVERFHERVGMDYSASSPAAVTFTLKFVDFKSGQVVWNAKFAKSQVSLTQNIFDLANFVQRSGRWVRAHEIAMEGVKAAVTDLHGDLNLEKNVKRFETGTYGQLKSGPGRFGAGPAGEFSQ